MKANSLVFSAAGTVFLLYPSLQSLAQTSALSISIEQATTCAIAWPSETNSQYRIEATTSLTSPVWQVVASNLLGTGASLKVRDDSSTTPQKFYRLVKTQLGSGGPGGISPQAILPQPGVTYPEKTIIGSSALGVQFSIPPNWIGGIRAGSSTMIFGSFTDPGEVISFITLAGDATSLTTKLGQSFMAGTNGGFQITQSTSLSNNVIIVEWTGYGVDNAGNSLSDVNLRLQAVVHPSGGIVGFAGLFTEPNRAVMQNVLNEFTSSTVTVERRTRTDLINIIAGKEFVWVKSSSAGNGGNSGSLQSWSQNNAFFCPGIYEITTSSPVKVKGSVLEY